MPRRTIKRRLRAALHREGWWPIVALVAIGGIVFTLIALFAPASTQTMLFGADGLVFTVLGLLMRSPLAAGDDEDDKKE